MLAAYLVVPGLALAFLIAGKGRLRRRIAQLAGGAGAMFAVSFVWYGAMMLVPAAHRPFVGDTTDNSWFSLIFGANGLGRVAGSGAGVGGTPGGAGGFGGSGELRRGRRPHASLQPYRRRPDLLVAAARATRCCCLGLWARRRAPRTDCCPLCLHPLGRLGSGLRGRSSASRKASSTPTDTTALAPAVAVLAAGGVVEMWDRALRSIGVGRRAWRRRDRDRRVGRRAARPCQRIRARGWHPPRSYSPHSPAAHCCSRGSNPCGGRTPRACACCSPFATIAGVLSGARRAHLLHDRHRRQHAERGQSARRPRERGRQPHRGARRRIRGEWAERIGRLLTGTRSMRADGCRSQPPNGVARAARRCIAGAASRPGSPRRRSLAEPLPPVRAPAACLERALAGRAARSGGLTSAGDTARRAARTSAVQ